MRMDQDIGEDGTEAYGTEEGMPPWSINTLSWFAFFPDEERLMLGRKTNLEFLAIASFVFCTYI